MHGESTLEAAERGAREGGAGGFRSCLPGMCLQTGRAVRVGNGAGGGAPSARWGSWSISKWKKCPEDEESCGILLLN